MNKFNFKVSVNQFGQEVSSDFIDQDEILLIDKFENILHNLKYSNKNEYKMLELGSNQCFYSLMFKSIIGENITTNYLVEPDFQNLQRGMIEFQINRYQGIFINKSIGNRNLGFGMGSLFHSNQTSVDELMLEYNIVDLDILHCDIDGSECIMLEGSCESLRKKIINYIVILTHSWSASHPASNPEIKKEFSLSQLHNNCLNHLKSYDYEILYEDESPIFGGDGLIIAKRK